MTSSAAYGKLYSTGYSGIVYCYDLNTGDILWEYTASAGLATPYGNYPLGIAAIADGKIYLATNEHSSGAPYWKGAELRCLDANSGEEKWTLYTHGATSYGSYGYAVADGYLVYLNTYDMQIYCIGKGPSKTSVDAPMIAVTLGSSVTIRGTVTDQSAGSKQQEQIARFPAGVPAISDEDQGAWMEYVYMQKPCPEDVNGVEVVITTVDPNGNTYELGRTTTGLSGTFGCAIDPPVPGLYKIIASFEGSDSYYGSFAETYITVEEATTAALPIEPEPTAPANNQPEPSASEKTEPKPAETRTASAATTKPEPTEPTQAVELPLITTEIGILAAVTVACIIGIVAFWALRKRK
jgi:cell division septation protein DedD